MKAGLPLVHPNQWPDGAAPFLRTGILPYYRAVMALGLRILECLAIGLDADPAIFTGAYDRPLGRGQLVYYPAIGEADIRAERFGAAAHPRAGDREQRAIAQPGGCIIAGPEDRADMDAARCGLHRIFDRAAKSQRPRLLLP